MTRDKLEQLSGTVANSVVIKAAIAMLKECVSGDRYGLPEQELSVIMHRLAAMSMRGDRAVRERLDELADED